MAKKHLLPPFPVKKWAKLNESDSFKKIFLLNSKNTIPFFNTDFIEEWEKAHYKELTETVESVAKNITFIQNFPFFGFSTDMLLGKQWQGHALNYSPLFWYKPLSEVNITQLLAYVMNEEQTNAKTAVLISTFLQALMDCADQSTLFMPSLQDHL